MYTTKDLDNFEMSFNLRNSLAVNSILDADTIIFIRGFVYIVIFVDILDSFERNASNNDRNVQIIYDILNIHT